MAETNQEDPLSVYESMQPYKKGVIVSYTNPLPIDAQEIRARHFHRFHPGIG